MKPIRALLAVLVPVSLFAFGCTEDVGSCEGDLRGMDTVKSGGVIQYAGQAIINTSCATVCHSSKAAGEARHGAPSGLDFDLVPVAEEDTDGGVGTTDAGNTIVALNAGEIGALRERQRIVFEKRNLIWGQVKEGLMPPDGLFKSFRRLAGITDSPEANPCQRATNGFLEITEKPSQEILRNWLACSTPIVESYGKDVKVNGVAGVAGYQYQECLDDVPVTPPTDAGTDSSVPTTAAITIEMLQTKIFEALVCSTCHPALNPPGKGIKLDLTSAAMSYATLVTDTSMKCNNKPYVTPGDPTKSWLYDVVALDNPGCGTERMPQNLAKLTASQLKLVSDWIAQGAKRASDVKSVSSSLNGGLDAGNP